MSHASENHSSASDRLPVLFESETQRTDSLREIVVSHASYLSRVIPRTRIRITDVEAQMNAQPGVLKSNSNAALLSVRRILTAIEMRLDQCTAALEAGTDNAIR